MGYVNVLDADAVGDALPPDRVLEACAPRSPRSERAAPSSRRRWCCRSRRRRRHRLPRRRRERRRLRRQGLALPPSAGPAPAVVTAWTLLVGTRDGRPVLLCDAGALTVRAHRRDQGRRGRPARRARRRDAGHRRSGAAGPRAPRLRPRGTGVRRRAACISRSGPGHRRGRDAPRRARTPPPTAPTSWRCAPRRPRRCSTSTRLAPGTLVTSISTNAPRAHEIDPAALRCLDVYCDHVPRQCARRASCCSRSRPGAGRPTRLRGDLARAARRHARPRPTGDRPVFFRSIGLGIEDIAIARAARGDAPAFTPFALEEWQSRYEDDRRLRPRRLRRATPSGSTNCRRRSGRGRPPARGRPALPGGRRDRGAARADHRLARRRPPDALVTVGAAEANAIAVAALLEAGDQGRDGARLPPGARLRAQRRSRRRRLPARPRQPVAPRPGRARTPPSPPRRKLIAVTNPNNPVGTILSAEEMDAVVAAAPSGGRLDPGRRGLPRQREARPTRSRRGSGAGRRARVRGSCRRPGLPGLRVGWLVAPPELVEAAWRRHEYATIATGMLSMHLASSRSSRRRATGCSPATARWSGRATTGSPPGSTAQGGLLSIVPPAATALGFVRYALDAPSLAVADALRTEADVLVGASAHFGVEGHLRITHGLEPGLPRRRARADRRGAGRLAAGIAAPRGRCVRHNFARAEHPGAPRAQGRAATLLSTAGDEASTSLLPGFLAGTLGAAPIALGLIEGAASAADGVARLGGGALAEDPRRRRRISFGSHAGITARTGLPGAPPRRPAGRSARCARAPRPRAGSARRSATRRCPSAPDPTATAGCSAHGARRPPRLRRRRRAAAVRVRAAAPRRRPLGAARRGDPRRARGRDRAVDHARRRRRPHRVRAGPCGSRCARSTAARSAGS